MTKKLFWDAFRFPIFVFILILIAVIAEEVLSLPLPFPAAIVPLAIAGGSVIYDAFEDVWRTRKITTGVLVVLALIGTIYTHEYMEGAEVAFMMLLGEALEEFAMSRAQHSVDGLLSSISTDARSKRERFFQQGGDIQQLTDRFSACFLPVILGICLLVFLFTHDIHRVMTVLVIACPCSLVLSGPSAVLACVENAAKNGIFFAKEDDLSARDYTQALMRKTRTIIRENILMFACLLNFIGIALSSLGFLPLVQGAVFHNLATVCVLLNSSRLLFFRK